MTDEATHRDLQARRQVAVESATDSARLANDASLVDEPSPAADPAGDLSFADTPRLELDQLLEQLRDRADDVLATQGRLRGLLRANTAVVGELSLPVVLRRIVEAARDLLGARYAALGVIGHDGVALEQFVYTGM